MSLFWRYTEMEQRYWSIETGPSINPDPPEDFRIQHTRSELQIYLRGKKGVYGGALAKSIAPLPGQSFKMQLSLELYFDESLLAYGQVLEMDTKFTDSEGFTYPGDYQILVASGQPQIGNPWFDWGEPIKLIPNIWRSFTVDYDLDYAAKTISINESAPIPAVVEGWETGEIVNQLQLCSNSIAGFHVVRYGKISVGVRE